MPKMESMTTENNKTAGALLKQGRLRQRLSIAECAKRTHIAQRYLEALEDERWNELPSESHRLGFLKLYSRFLGVPADEVLEIYSQQRGPKTLERPNPAAAETKEKRDSPSMMRTARPAATWSPSTIPQVIGLMVLLMILAWVVYHAISPRYFDQNPMPFTQRRAPTQSRLAAPKA